MNATKLLFDVAKIKGPRQPRRVLMHVIDAGPGYDATDLIKFGCKCGYESDWIYMRFAEAKRGIPCPVCNNTKTEERANEQ